MKKLSPKQQELLNAMKNGVRVLYIGTVDSYYFRTDNMRVCNATAMALVKKGYAKYATKGSLRTPESIVLVDQPKDEA